ncbi:MAG: flagella synthesis protein FlgN [Azonexus sp.]
MSSLNALIEQEIALISRFISVLQEEQDTLKHARIADLPALTADKSRLVDQLNTLEDERLAMLGLDRQPGAMEAWLKTHGTEQPAAALWRSLLELARRAKTLHDLNARLLDMHARQTSELLAALTQQGDRPALYSANGQTQTASGSRIIDSA